MQFAILIFCLLAGCGRQLRDGSDAIDSNRVFAEAPLSAFSSAYSASMKQMGVRAVQFESAVRAGPQELAPWLEEIFYRANQQDSLIVYAGADSSRQHPSLKFTVDAWQFSSHRVPASKKVEQRLAVGISYVLAAGDGRVLDSGRRDLQATRQFASRNTAALANAGMPAFLQPSGAAENTVSGLFETGLIAAATAASVFLLFALRSR